MTLSNEGEILRNNTNFSTNAAANTLQTDTLLAAPPAGSRTRIYGIKIGFDMHAATPAASAGITGRIGGIPFGISWPQKPTDELIITQGFPLGGATALQFLEYASVAAAGGIAYFAEVFYTVEII